MGKIRSGRSPAGFGYKTKIAEMLEESSLRHMLGHYIAWIVGAGHLHKLKILRPHFILHPQFRHRQVPHFPEAPAAADPDSRSGIGEDPEMEVQSEIAGQGSQPDPFGRALADS